MNDPTREPGPARDVTLGFCSDAVAHAFTELADGTSPTALCGERVSIVRGNCGEHELACRECVLKVLKWREEREQP